MRVHSESEVGIDDGIEREMVQCGRLDVRYRMIHPTIIDHLISIAQNQDIIFVPFLAFLSRSTLASHEVVNIILVQGRRLFTHASPHKSSGLPSQT